MENHNRDLGRERNPITYRKHRRETFLQITLPMLIGALILLIFALLSTQMGAGEIRVWADISLIWLIIPVIVLTLLMFVLLVGSVYGITMLIQMLPVYSFRMFKAWIQLRAIVRITTDRIVEPVLRVNGFSSGSQTLWRQITRRRSG